LHVSRVILALATVGAAGLVPAQQAAATTPAVRGPIVSYRCPPAPLWCTRTLKPGVTLTHWRAKMRSGTAQNIYKLSWRLGDPRVHLYAEALNRPTSTGAISLGKISHWAASSAPAGFLGAINADFFHTTWSSWSVGRPSGMLVQARHIVDFGAGDSAVGYKPNGEMVMGTPSARPAKFLFRNGDSATIAAFDPGSSLSGVKGDQVVIKTVRTAPVNIPSSWTGYIVGSSTAPAPFTTMLRGSDALVNSTGNSTHPENVAGFRFGNARGSVNTVTLPVVRAASSSVQLGPGQALVMAKTGYFAEADLTKVATHSKLVKLTVDAEAWSTVQDVMGGKPQLVQNGSVMYPTVGGNPSMMSSDGWQWRYPHWRPAVAESKTRGWLIITGGVHYGNGVYGWDWGKMLVQLGAVNAMGFDNNSSTEMYVPRNGLWSFSPGWERDITEATAVAWH